MASKRVRSRRYEFKTRYVRDQGYVSDIDRGDNKWPVIII
jgi:hypothetical protein